MLLNRNNIKSFIRPMGVPLLGEGVMMLCTLLPAWHFHDGTFLQILLCGLFTLAVGSMILLCVPKPQHQPEQRISFLIVSTMWLVMMLFGALPFLTTGSTIHFTEACFEVMSGLTATGASVFGEVEALPASVIFWRSVLQWIGGYGIVVLVLAVAPSLGLNKYSLYTAETSSADNTGKVATGMAANIRYTLGVYVVLSAAFIFILRFMGMQFWDAINLTFSCISSGGFSPYSDNIARFPAAQQYMLAVVMLTGGFNFTFLYHFLTFRWNQIKGKLDQLSAYLIITLCSILFVVGALHWVSNYNWSDALRFGVVQTVNAISTTGVMSTDIELWWKPILFLYLVLIMCGAMAGSTCGGIKTMRVLILIRNVRTIMRNRLHPNAVNPVRLNGQPVSKDMISNVMVIFFVYLISVIIGIALLMLCGVGATESIGAVTACITGYGPGLGLCGGFGNYAFMSPLAQWILIVIMLMGRLECLTLIIIFLPSFWRKASLPSLWRHSSPSKRTY